MRRTGLVFFCSIAMSLMVGCVGGGLNIRGIEAPLEYKQEKVGLVVHTEPETFYYPGSSTQDISDLMSYHLTQTLPFNTQSALQELYKDVEMNEEGPQIHFKSQDLAGYFEIKIASVRYDWPDPRATKFRADVQLVAEFKTERGEVVWNGIFRGTGIGFTDTDIRLTRFGREATTALEDAFQNVVYELQEGVLHSKTLRDYFRWIQEKKNPAPTSAPASTP